MIRACLIGFGMAGRVFHAPLLSSVEGLELAAVVERNSSNAAQRYPGITTHRSLDAALADSSLNLFVVATPSGTSLGYPITVNATQPGLLAPSTFNVGGKQYVVAQLTDGTYVLPTGAISGLTSRLAVPGDIIVIYGVGFGPVTPDIPAGQLVGEANSLATDFHISIGGVECQVQYDGLAPSYTGLYQFNIVVPTVASGNAPLTFTVDGVNGTQTLYVAIGQ